MGKRYSQNRLIQHDWQRKQAFGLEATDKWPDGGLPPRIIMIAEYAVLHKVLPKGQELNGTKYRGRRAVAQCPKCHKWVCAGHLGQHMSAHGIEL